MVKFLPLNITDEDSTEYVLSHVDNSMQYGEDLEPKVTFPNNRLHMKFILFYILRRNLRMYQKMNDEMIFEQ